MKPYPALLQKEDSQVIQWLIWMFLASIAIWYLTLISVVEDPRDSKRGLKEESLFHSFMSSVSARILGQTYPDAANIR